MGKGRDKRRKTKARQLKNKQLKNRNPVRLIDDGNGVYFSEDPMPFIGRVFIDRGKMYALEEADEEAAS